MDAKNFSFGVTPQGFGGGKAFVFRGPTGFLDMPVELQLTIFDLLLHHLDDANGDRWAEVGGYLLVCKSWNQTIRKYLARNTRLLDWLTARCPDASIIYEATDLCMDWFRDNYSSAKKARRNTDFTGPDRTPEKYQVLQRGLYMSMLWAAWDDHPEFMGRILKADFRIVCWINLDELLHAAIRLDRADCVSHLVDAGADIEYRKKYDELPLTALAAAVRHNSPQSAKRLLERGASPFARIDAPLKGFDIEGGRLVQAKTSLLDHAIINYLHDIADSLLEHGASSQPDYLDGRIWLWAIISDEEMFRILLKHRPKKNEFFTQTNSLLMHCIRYDKVRMVDMLMAFGDDVNNALPGHASPLVFAVVRGDADIIQRILGYGGKITVEVLSVLHTSEAAKEMIFDANREMCYELLENITIDTSNPRPWGYFRHLMPLYIALRLGDPELVQRVLNRGANPDRFLGDIGEPLRLAIRCDKPKVFQTLLQNGACVDDRTLAILTENEEALRVCRSFITK